MTTARPDRAPAVVTASGEIDQVTSEHLQAAFDQAVEPSPPSLLIDLRRVVFCDSTGLSTLIGLRGRAITLGLQLQIVPSSTLLRLAERTGLSTFLPFTDS
ncbi:STAS domain-containing protein [Amycolatopsis orientalis]|uniref:STAS domain-containing protein n=1 Tax=Amycolatopsis orientalis TaxID=31958 RepID=UPI001F192F33|nr:STAS domain-containing protein [Amycolatopsis orientalis]